MASPLFAGAVRHSILEMAPLELDCMNALWPLGEATVRDIQVAMAATKPRAYTTIMTILDRLAQKGVVQRRKRGRAWVYSANVSEEEARTRAIAQLVDGFFDGSAEALAAHLATRGATIARNNVPRPPVSIRRPVVVPQSDAQASAQRESAPSTPTSAPVEAPREKTSPLDTTLL